MKWNLGLLSEREVGAWNKGRLSHWQLHKDQRQWDQRRCGDAPLCRWSTTPRWRYIPLWMKKARLLNGSAWNKGPHPTVLTANCVCSVVITALQSGTISKRDMLRRLYRAAHSAGAFSLSLAKVVRSHSAQSGVLKINEDIARVNQLTKHA